MFGNLPPHMTKSTGRDQRSRSSSEVPYLRIFVLINEQ
jgi:hypothetical protein